MEEKLKLLVVDDEPDNLDLLYRTFRRDFIVFRATSGAQALDLLDKEGEMAIIISDQRMPKMNGTELLSRTVERFPDTIRMVLTGYTDVEDLVSAINSGKVFKYITKPWNSRKLKEVVDQASETYRAIKQRTRALSRALRQESLSNSITTAIRSSLDYDSTLQTVVEALGTTFDADLAVICPARSASIQESSDLVVYRAQRNHPQPTFEQILSDLASSSTSPAADEIVADSFVIEDISIERIVVPLVDNETVVATIYLYKTSNGNGWTSGSVDLLRQISGQMALAISHAKLYQQIHLQSVKMRAELEVARKIQSNLLHQSWPEIPGIKIQARCQPAREVGGDFFEVFMHPQGDIWLAVGDVSGKGVPAALFMASAISVLRRELSQEKSPNPHQVMSNLNESLANDLMSNNCFITMALIRYSAKTGQLVYANAGHVYPVVWSHRSLVAGREANKKVGQDSSPETTASTEVEPTYLDVRGVPLGILPDWKATSGELSLTDGDVVLLTSDGITEATVPDYRGSGSCSMLNQEGLWNFLQQQPADLNLDNLLSYIHLPEGEQEDDQTILSLEVTSC